MNVHGEQTFLMTCTTQKQNEFWMPDLVLHHVLVYIVHGENYRDISLVCKRWKNLLQTRFPPPEAYHLLLCMERRVILKKQHVSELVRVFESLQQRSCPLYRFKAVQQDWPRLESRFRARLVNVVYEMCVQRSPNNLARIVYESTCEFLELHATKCANEMHALVVKAKEHAVLESWHQVLPFVKRLVQLWCDWQGGVSIVSGLVRYVNRCGWVRHSDHSPNLVVEQRSNLAMAYLLAKHFEKKQEQTVSLVAFLKYDDTSFRERALVFLTLQLCTDLCQFPSSCPSRTMKIPPVLVPDMSSLDKRVLPFLLAAISNSI